MIKIISMMLLSAAMMSKTPVARTAAQIVNAQTIILRSKQIDSVTKLPTGVWAANMIPSSSAVDFRMNAQQAAVADSMNKVRSWANDSFLKHQVQSDYAQGSSADPSFIKNKPYIPDTTLVVTAGRLRDSVNSIITKIPTNNNQLSNGAAYITGYVETDPIYSSSVSHAISANDTGHYSLGWRDRISSGSYSAGSTTLLRYDGSPVVITGFPTNTNQLTNGAGFISGYTETDPVFVASAVHNVSATDTGHYSLGWRQRVLSGTYSAGSATFLRYDGTSFIVSGFPTNTSDLTNGAGFITGITGANVAAALGYTPPNPSGTTLQYMRGNGSVATLNTSVVPENVNLYYTDPRARAALSVTNTGSGVSSYNSTTGVINIPANAQVQSNYTGADTSQPSYIKNKPNLVKVYSKSGALRDFNIKILCDTFTVNVGNDYTIDISALAYTQIFSVHAIPIKPVSNGYQSPGVSVDHFTVNNVYLDFTQGNNALPVLALLFPGTIFVTDFTSMKVAITIFGY